MKCQKCSKDLNAAEALYCPSCGSVYCGGCNKDLCDCLGELRYFN